MKKYQIIYADPPWPYKKGKLGVRPALGNKGMLARLRYKIQGLKWIKELPIQRIIAKDSILFLWTTSSMLPQALEVIEAWGFRFVTLAFCWSKITKKGKPKTVFGYWTLPNVELCLIGTQGKPTKITRSRRDIKQFVEEQPRGHSKKPIQVRERINWMFPKAKKLELFAREKHKGWDVWGNEVKSDIKLGAKA